MLKPNKCLACGRMMWVGYDTKPHFCSRKQCKKVIRPMYLRDIELEDREKSYKFTKSFDEVTNGKA